jgi:hypothetical protein
MSTPEVSVTLASSVSVPADFGVIFADIVYMRSVKGVPSGELPDLPASVQDTVRVVLKGLTGKAELPDVVKLSTIEIRVLTPNGGVALRKSASAGTPGPVSISFSAEDVKLLAAVPPKPPSAPVMIDRRAFFVPVGDARYAFEISKLQIAPLTITDGGWKKGGLDRLFQMDTPATASIPWRSTDWSPAGFAWTSTHLEIDGKFKMTFLEHAGDAWLWWLSGPQPAIGVVVDDLSRVRVQPLGIPLPPMPPSLAEEPPSRVPTDVTESEIVSNPGVYTEDPGEFCRPFKNPERVLGERSFFVTLRVEQPVIGSEASVKIFPMPTLMFDPSTIAADPGTSTGSPGRAVDSHLHVGALISESPSLNFVRHAIPNAYANMLQHLDRGRTGLDAQHPVQWEGDISRYQATTVARGHILEFRMRWRSNGYSLGTVAKTLTLAPRQTKRIQKIEWRRTEAGSRREATQLSDQVQDSVSRERDYDDSVQAHLSEWERGESSSSTGAAAGGFGFAGPGFVIGGGGGGSHAQSSSSQSGGRDTSAAEEQRLRDTIRRYGDSLRRLQSMVVTEVTQEESVTGTTEVVRNQNFAHALTVIYYQILRHLKVETAIGGVRECLFVPFAITPFTIARAHRWRDLIRRGLRDSEQAGALKYLKDVLTNFASSEVPPGRRSDQSIRYVYGSLYVTVAIERPRDKDDGAFEPNAWIVLRQFLGSPAAQIYERLRALDTALRDVAFQRDHAPTIAATWVDTLELWAGATRLDADFTLATRYSFNGTVRVDFTAPIRQSISRETMASIRVVATKDLPPGSIANLRHASFTYETDQFQRTVRVDQGAHDLVAVETGVHDPMGGTLFAPPDAWERRNIRQEMTVAVQGLVEHLNEYVEFYHKVIWWGMDRDRLFMLIDGFHVPGTNDISIGSVVERDPIAIVGNALVFRVSAGAFLGLGDIKSPKDLFDHYVGGQGPTEPMLLSLPTDGLYAQTVMDECGALEEHYGNTNWALNDPDPELGVIAPELLATRRAEPSATTPTPLPQTIINLQNVPEAPAPAGLAAALGAVQSANAFRDMAGLAGTQANAAAGFQTAASLASSFGAQAAALKLADLAAKAHATQTADQKLASIQKAKDKQLIDNTEAARQASSVLEQMSGGDQNLTSDPNVQSLLASAAVGDRSASITRGAESVEVRAPGDDGGQRRLLQLTRDGVISVEEGGGAGGGSGPSVLFQTPGTTPTTSPLLPSLKDRKVWKTLPKPKLQRPCCAFGHDIKLALGASIANIIDPASIGKHSYQDASHPNEQWGIVYTCKGGFVDLGHALDAVDIAAYFATRAMDLLPGSKSDTWTQEADITIKFKAPASATPLARTCSLLGARIAYELTTWHEIWSWFSATPNNLLSQMYSAFSPEDAYSNLFGALLAGPVLQSTKNFNDAVDVVLADSLAKLKPVLMAETKAAMDKVDGRWWDSSKKLPSDNDQFLLRRNFDVGPQVTPWLVTASGVTCPSPTPVVLTVPEKTPNGSPLKDLYNLEIDVTSALGGPPFPGWPAAVPSTTITPADFPALIAAARAAAISKFGNDADKA